MQTEETYGEYTADCSCGDCGTRATCTLTRSGFRCESCCDSEEPVTETYAPSLNGDRNREYTPGENLADAIDELPDISFTVELQDGSTYEMDTMSSVAVLMKYGDEWEQFISELASTVAEHYEKKTEPTRFSEFSEWGTSSHEQSQQSYDSHAALAPVVSYPMLRAAKMQLMLSGMSEEGNDPVTVIGISENTLTKYSEEGVLHVDSNKFSQDGDSE